jgi:inhibitor of cysteine peptidase
MTLLWAPRPALADDALSVMSGGNTSGIFDVLEFVAGGAGFYKEQHLAVVKEYGGNPSAAAQLVASGKADVASIPVEPVMAGYDKGLRLQFFLSKQARYAYVLAVLADSPITSLAGFKGSLLAETTVGSPGELLAESMLAGAGLRKSDYSFQMTGFGAAGLAAITSKRVDGVAFPSLEIVNDTITAGVRFRVFRHPILNDISDVGFAAAPATIQTKADQLKRFARAIVEAAVFVRANPAAAARLYLQGGGQTVTDEALAKTTRVIALLEDDFPAADPANKRIGLFSPAKMELYATYLADYGFTRAPVPGAALVTDQFIAYANDFDHAAVVKLAQSMTSDPSPSAAPLVTITDTNAGQTIRIAVGQSLDVRLAANPTTGYEWSTGALRAGPLMRTGRSTFAPSTSGLLGAGGTQVFAYRGTAPGTAHLSFEYARPWEHTAPAKHIAVTVVVR